MQRHCQICGGEMRFSHREYAGGGASAPVWRCKLCGALTRDTARAREEQPAQRRSRQRAPVDEGPPENPVLDPEIARRLLDGRSEER